ncbi:hypothetical protein G7070_03860 [Propioniciclava coleopterorum]|uniref:Uncharacterized protein n=1 Tax=Propioniciclava coleopterorum TaxID=2714937 RepID=A0A6G7Y4M5_9ACTN|nr:hypothetical protein [Propioniciclava coleopterorum]QIK71567.1 hypothetical protein G7070_03860 [Propioniciclava coleopterorum]
MVLHDLGAAQAPGWLALVVTLVLLIALLLLFVNMRKHLKRADYPDLPTSDEVRAQQARGDRRGTDQP